MMIFISSEHPHRRHNPLTGEWVFVSPHRTKRPWQGQVEKSAPDQRPTNDPRCYLCPGNERAGGVRNPEYEHTFVFTNDFTALLPDVPPKHQPGQPLFQDQPVQDTSRVICLSPRHDLTLPEMTHSDIRKVIDVWAEQAAELGQQYQFEHSLIHTPKQNLIKDELTTTDHHRIPTALQPAPNLHCSGTRAGQPDR